MHVAEKVVAVACQGKDAAEVQMAMGELGAKPIQIPSGKGKPSELLTNALNDIAKSEKLISDSEGKMETWAQSNGRMLLAVQEHLERENEILTGHTLMRYKRTRICSRCMVTYCRRRPCKKRSFQGIFAS
jgi:vacuolar-type H+-ATPase subunit I/STV1